MCGITGFFSPEKDINTSKYYNSHLLIKHRGPDDEGFVSLFDWEIKVYKGDDTIAHFQNHEHINSVKYSRLILGHRRLSIIDLTHQGHQPFYDEEKNFFLVYNGELFNYVELKDELEKYGYKFLTNSDTEVVLKSYIHWGNDAFNKFNGMWAIAIFDKKKNCLVLSRDRFGIKPLYYSLIDGVLCFSSEMKFLQSFIDKKLTLNNKSIREYIDECLLNHSPQTFWSEIKELEPAYILTFQNSKVSVNKYWDYSPAMADYSEREALDKFEAFFEDSLKLRMRSDVEVGTLLSGGLDSSLIVCTLYKLGLIKEHNFKSFSAVFEDERFSEKKYIDETINKTGLMPYFVYPKAEELEDYLDKLLYHIEEPFRSLSVYSQFLIYRKIRGETNVKVVLNGQGADELFGGYTYHYNYLFGSLLKKIKIRKLLQEIKLFKNNRGIKSSTIIVDTLKNMIKSLCCSNYFNSATFNELKGSALREYLKYDDRNSMAFGIEARVPFLDYRLVEFAFSLDEKYKINNFVNKRIEREYAKGIIPEEIINRKDKMGFISPQEEWQRKEIKDNLFEIYPIISSLSSIRIPKNKLRVLKKYQDYLRGKNNDWGYAWRVYCLYRWMKVNKVI